MSRRRRRNIVLTAGGGTPPPPGPDVNALFSVDLWAGDSVSENIVNGIDLTGSAEAMVWIKARTTTSAGFIFDTIRGPLIQWQPQNTAGSATTGNTLTSFNADGYSVGSNANVNANLQNLVGWTYKSAPRFFDVIAYNGTGVDRQIAHNLQKEPAMIIIKRRDSAGSAVVYHKFSGANPGSQYFLLPGTALPTVNDTTFGGPGVVATDTYFSLGTNTTVNDAVGGTYMAYLFAQDDEANGIVKGGVYTGNGLAAGPTIDLGWQPQMLFIRRLTGGTGNWNMLDTTRGILSPGVDNVLFGENTTIEATANDRVDLTSTGFTITSNSTSYNNSGDQYVYLAIRA